MRRLANGLSAAAIALSLASFLIACEDPLTIQVCDVVEIEYESELTGWEYYLTLSADEIDQIVGDRECVTLQLFNVTDGALYRVRLEREP